MNRLYTYHTRDHRVFETSLSLNYDISERAIEDGGHVKVWDATTTNAESLLETLTTLDEVEGRLTAEDRKLWFKRNDAVKPVACAEKYGCKYPGQCLGGCKAFDEEHSSVLELEAKQEVPLVDKNVKTAAAAGKPTFNAVPPIAFFGIGAAMQDGANKYGRFNWRETSVTASVFYDAMLRHVFMWWNGEDHALDSLIHHLNHMQAGAAIVQDAELHGVFNDDRGKHENFDIDKIMSIVKRKS